MVMTVDAVLGSGVAQWHRTEGSSGGALCPAAALDPPGRACDTLCTAALRAPRWFPSLSLRDVAVVGAFIFYNKILILEQC